MELKDCPNCHERIGINDIECPYCKYIDDPKKEPKKSNNKVVNYCFNCGEKLDKDYKYCSTCGVDLLNKEMVKQENNNKKENMTIYGTLFNTLIIIPMLVIIIYFVIFFVLGIDEGTISNKVVNIFNNVSNNIFFLCPTAALIVIITGKIKYPHNQDINIKFWISIAIVIFCIIPFIIFMKTCNSCISSID